MPAGIDLPRPDLQETSYVPGAAEPVSVSKLDLTPFVADKSNLRMLAPGDEQALEIHLARHWTSSMVLRANFRAVGIVDGGGPFHGSYSAAWDGATILGVAAHYRNGILVLQSQRALAQVVRATIGNSKRPLSGIMGPWSQVEAAVTALAIPQKRRAGGKVQTLMTLDAGKFQPPEPVKRKEARYRLATTADLEPLVVLRAVRDADILGVSDSHEHRNALRAVLEQQIAAKTVYVAETAQSSTPVAMASFEVTLSDGVQIGNACALPAKDGKERGYAAVAIAGTVNAALAAGLRRIVLLADKSAGVVLSTFQAIGFTATDAYGLFNILPASPEESL